MKGTVEEILRKKYEEVVVPDDIFDFSKIDFDSVDREIEKEYHLFNKIACIAIIIAVILTGIVIKLDIDYQSIVHNNITLTL